MKRIIPFLYSITYLCVLLLAACDDYVSFDGSSPSVNARYLYTETADLQFSAKNNTVGSFMVNAVQTPWGITGVADWLNVMPSYGSENQQVSVHAQENPSADEVRTCVLNLSSTESDYDVTYGIAVSQSRAIPYIELSQSELIFETGGGTQMVTVNTNMTYAINSSKDWLTVTKSKDNKTLTLKVEANPTGVSRYTTVTLSGKTFTSLFVTQNAAGITTTQSSKMDIPRTGGSYNLKIKADAAWTVTSSDYSWIEVTPASGQAGSSTLTLSVAPNNTTSARTGHVFLRIGSTTSLDITISQVGIYLSLQANSLTFDADACSRSLEVESNTTWKVQSSPDWITVTKETITGNKALSISASKYNETVDRQGEIVLGVDGLNISKTVKVTQKGRSFQNLVGTLQFRALASTQTFDIDTDGAWTAISSESWLTLSKLSGTGKATITATVNENTSDKKRTATIRVCVGSTEKTILATQEAHFLTISPTSFAESLPSTGGSNTVSIASDDSWKAASKANWLAVSPASGKGNINVKITAADNPSVSDRRDTVSITPVYAQPVRVVVWQAARYLRVNVSSEGISLFYKGGESDPVQIETDGTYRITKEGDWFTVKESGKTFTITATENTGEEKRQGKVIIALTGLKQGESKSIEIPIIQRTKKNCPELDDFTADEDWNILLAGDSHFSVTIVGFSSDENWNVGVGGSSFGSTVTGFDEDSNWNNLIR